MSTTQHKRTSSQQYNRSSPGVRRILKEAQEIATCPSRDFTAHPLEHDLFEWHFTMRGPPAPSPYADGFYHGRIILSPHYPMRPPMFRFLTDSGRFEVNRDICLSISGFHEETWQPSWSIRVALTALRAFMDSDPEGQVGGLDCTAETRRELAAKSHTYRCPECGGGGEEDAMKLSDDEAAESSRRDVVPPTLRFGYKDQMKASTVGDTDSATAEPTTSPQNPTQTPSPAPPPSNVPPASPFPQQQQQQQQQQPVTRNEDRQEPAMFIPFGAAGQHQPVPAGRAVPGPAGAGVPPANIPTPTVAAAVQAPAPLALANTSNEDRTNGYIDLAIGVLLSVLVALVLRKV